jgi:hypothetical protein
VHQDFFKSRLRRGKFVGCKTVRALERRIGLRKSQRSHDLRHDQKTSSRRAPPKHEQLTGKRVL